MKNFLSVSIALLIFSVSLSIFQLSCNKQANAQSQSNANIQQNKIVYTKKNLSVGQFEIWISDYSGAIQNKVNILMPTGYIIAGDGHAKVSPDGAKLFFVAYFKNDNSTHIFSCNTDGSKVAKIIDGTNAGFEGLFLGSAY